MYDTIIKIPVLCVIVLFGYAVEIKMNKNFGFRKVLLIIVLAALVASGVGISVNNKLVNNYPQSKKKPTIKTNLSWAGFLIPQTGPFP